MIWTVIGNSGLSFQVDKNGLSISGKGRQTCEGIVGIFVKALPAQWTIYRASEASETANSISAEVSTLKHHLDAAAVKVTTTPISIINFHEKIDNANPSCVFFSTFLPDAYFANVWEVAKLITSQSDMSYQIRFGFDGFMPRKIRSVTMYLAMKSGSLVGPIYLKRTLPLCWNRSGRRRWNPVRKRNISLILLRQVSEKLKHRSGRGL